MYRLGLIISLTLAVEAMTVSTAFAAADIPTRDQLLADAEVQRTAGHRMQALALCEDVLQRWPNDTEALQLQVRLLSELGGAAQALQLAHQINPPLAPREMAQLEADLNAHRARWAAAQPADPRQPYVEADRAVTDMNRTMASYGSTQPDIAARTSADRLISYSEASRNARVVSDYQAMLRAGKPLQPYTESTIADALLQQQHPEQAIPLYEDSIKRNPGPYARDESDPRIGLAYAYLEAGRSRDAIMLIDKTAAAEPAWLPSPGSAQPLSNPHKTEADLNAALIREYVWLYQDAWQRLSALRAQAPLNARLWRELGNLERVRGWPRRSEDTLVSAAGLDPNDMGIRLGAIEDWRDLYDFARIEPALQQVEAIIPRDQRVLQAQAAWDREKGWQFDIYHDRGRGDDPNFGEYDYETHATLQSPLLDDHWRIYGVTDLDNASLQEGQVQRDRLGLGLRGYARGLEFYVQALPGISQQAHGTALEAGVNWFATDQWTFSADWSNKGDVDVPLRASYYGIVAHALDTSVKWRASELTSVKLTASHDSFSDNNQRNTVQADVVQRLYTAPYFILDGGVQVGTTHNTLTSVPYYSPAQATWALFTTHLENLLYQHYVVTWRQSIDIAAGSYQERYYGSSWAANVRYGQTIEPRAGLAFGWGLSWGSQPYDGKRDDRVMLDLSMHWGE